MAAILGVLLLVGGFYFYIQIAGPWQQSQSWLLQAAGAFSPSVREHIDSIRAWYFGSIGAMLLGGILTVAGLVGSRQTSIDVTKNAPSTTPSNTPPMPWYETNSGNWSVPIVVLAIIAAILVIQSSNSGAPSPAAAQRPVPAPAAPASTPAPALSNDTSTPQSPPDYVQAPAPTSEAVDELTAIKSSELAYYQQNGTFTRNMRKLGITTSIGSPILVGSHYTYVIARANQTEVVIEATGKFLTPASGIKLALFLNAGGTTRIVRYR